MTKKRLPRAGERLKVPSVRSMTDSSPVAPATKPPGEPEKPTDELSEELVRTIKAAYQ